MDALSRGSEHWTAAQYAAAARLIAHADQHVVPRRQMEEALGQLQAGVGATATAQAKAGELVLRRLAEANAVGVQPNRRLAGGKLLAAFNQGARVVTAPSPTMLYAMRQFCKGQQAE